jgi:hypothetical protein
MTSVDTPVAVNLNTSDWGILGTQLVTCNLENILRLAGPNSIRCINKNGRALANAWAKKERDDRAKTVEGHEENWTAYTTVCLTMEKNADNLRGKIPIFVRGDCDILIAMVRAAFGRLVLGGAVCKSRYLLRADTMDDPRILHGYRRPKIIFPVWRSENSNKLQWQISEHLKLRT